MNQSLDGLLDRRDRLATAWAGHRDRHHSLPQNKSIVVKTMIWFFIPGNLSTNKIMETDVVEGSEPTDGPTGGSEWRSTTRTESLTTGPGKIDRGNRSRWTPIFGPFDSFPFDLPASVGRSALVALHLPRPFLFCHLLRFFFGWACVRPYDIYNLPTRWWCHIQILFTSDSVNCF